MSFCSKQKEDEYSVLAIAYHNVAVEHDFLQQLHEVHRIELDMLVVHTVVNHIFVTATNKTQSCLKKNDSCPRNKL